jgi:ATP-dependent Lon protease
LHITDAALLYIASRYTREAGVRSLERHVGSVVRFKAVQWADSNQQFSGSGVAASYNSVPGYQKVVDVQHLQEILGLEWWDPDERDRVDRKGIVNGMVVQGEGEGGILTVETILVPGTGKLKLTGSLGDVLRESGELALSWVRHNLVSEFQVLKFLPVCWGQVKSNAYALRITTSVTDDPLLHPDPIDVHLHLPAGAQKKDGPSAGITISACIVP